MWKKREPKIIHFAGLPEDTEPDLLSFRKEKKCKGPQWFPGRLKSAKRCQSVRVQNDISTRCLLCQKMMSSPVTASAISGSWCMDHISITSRESLFSPTWVTDKMLQWQQKSGQVKHMPVWSGRKALVTRICSLRTSKASRVIFSLFLTVVTEKKQYTKVGWQQRGRESRHKKSENKNKLLCTLHRWEEISL